ncbi:hypothetical protein DFH28DRAFT_921872 [Melampsora americana]|nr:hypothetical protein DFH28DRAFT_921872 [Melampsora americana]
MKEDQDVEEDNDELDIPDDLFHSEDNAPLASIKEIDSEHDDAPLASFKELDSEHDDAPLASFKLDSEHDDAPLASLKELGNIFQSEDEAPLASIKELDNMFHSEDEAPLASVKAPIPKRPRAKPAKRREDTPEELETTVPVETFMETKPSIILEELETTVPVETFNATKSKRPRAKRASAPIATKAKRPRAKRASAPIATKATKAAKRKLEMQNIEQAKKIEPPAKKLKGWKGWAIVEEHENDKKKDDDLIDAEDAKGNSNGGMNLRRTNLHKHRNFGKFFRPLNNFDISSFKGENQRRVEDMAICFIFHVTGKLPTLQSALAKASRCPGRVSCCEGCGSYNWFHHINLACLPSVPVFVHLEPFISSPTTSEFPGHLPERQTHKFCSWHILILLQPNVGLSEMAAAKPHHYCNQGI